MEGAGRKDWNCIYVSIVSSSNSLSSQYKLLIMRKKTSDSIITSDETQSKTMKLPNSLDEIRIDIYVIS